MTSKLIVLSPQTEISPSNILERGEVTPKDVIADFRGFPYSVYTVNQEGMLESINATAENTIDYLNEVIEWLANFTGETSLQNVLSSHGYGFWWTTNFKIIDFRNIFIWLDLLESINEFTDISLIVMYGCDPKIEYLLKVVIKDIEVTLKEITNNFETVSFRKKIRGVEYLQRLIRMVLGVGFLAYSLISRKPDLIFFSNSSKIRANLRAGKIKLEDDYINDIMRNLELKDIKSWVVDNYLYSDQFSWRRIFARGSYFPNDILLFLANPSLARFGIRRKTYKKWINRWQAEKCIITSALTYKGYDFSPLMLSHIYHYFAFTGPFIDNMVDLWTRLLKVWKPKILYLLTSYSTVRIPIIIAAKKLQITTTEHQHGIISEKHIGYVTPKTISNQSLMPICDYILVWGQYVKDLLLERSAYQRDQIVVCGSPKIDRILQIEKSERNLRELFEIPTNAKIVLYTSNALINGIYERMLDSIADSDDPNTIWLIKLHPNEMTQEVWKRHIILRNLSEKVKVITGLFDFYELISISDIHISYGSTTLIETAILQKLNICLDVGFTDPFGFKDCGACIHVKPDELGPYIADLIIDSDQIASFIDNQKDFAAYWYTSSGDSLDKITDVLMQNLQ